MAYTRKIRNKFNGYDVIVNYYPSDGDYCDRYYLKVAEDDVDSYAYDLLEEILDECGLTDNDTYNEDGYKVWELIPYYS